MRKTGKKVPAAAIAGALLFLAMLGILLFATLRLSDEADQQGVDATRDAIQRAVVLCYATEGFYPPTLSYIEDRYGLQIDYSHYVVDYSVFASNIMPRVEVIRR